MINKSVIAEEYWEIQAVKGRIVQSFNDEDRARAVFNNRHVPGRLVHVVVHKRTMIEKDG